MNRYIRAFIIWVLIGLTSKAFADYTGPELKLPLPGGYYWGVNTVPGSYYTHTGDDYYSIDFDDDIENDGIGDLGEGKVGVLAAASGHASVYPNHGDYGNAVIIDHGGGYETIYGHLYSFMVSEGEVKQGQVLGTLGNTGNSGGPHVHFQVTYYGDSSSNNEHLSGVAVDGILFTEHYVGEYYHSNNYEVPDSALLVLDSKADELWHLHPEDNGRNCGTEPLGLICSETQNVSLDTSLRDPYYLEYWDGGTWGEVLLTYDEDLGQDQAYVVRHGFLGYYHAADRDSMGPPLGDEMDQTRMDEYTAYDSYCSPLYGSQGYSQEEVVDACIQEYCGSSRTYTSVQRFQYLTLCYSPEIGVVCDPKYEVEHGYMNSMCSREAEAMASGQTVEVGDMVDVSGTVYWYDGMSLRGLVSADAFNACGFDWGEIQEGTAGDLDPLGWGEVVDDPVDCGMLKDGDVFTHTGTTTVYQYVSGLKRPITSASVFDACGFDWSVIQTFPASTITPIPDGSVINSGALCYLTPDLVWRQYTSGNLTSWFMDGTAISGGSSVSSSDTSWSVVGSGDFSRDGSVDLLWRHNSSPYAVYLWEMTGSTVVTSVQIASSSDPNWVIRGVSDFTSDGQPDILWKNQSTGELSLWVVSQEEVVTSVDISSTSDTSWDIRATGDLTGDGDPDILWRNPSNGALSLWELDGTSYVSSITISSSSLTTWDVEGIGDFTSDGQNDILWRNPSTGEMNVWEMNGTSYVSSISMTSSDTGWDAVTVGQMTQ